ncbi:MAG: hypothetical protein WC658_02360 [Candidatus Omnitrophota bacterium]
MKKILVIALLCYSVIGLFGCVGLKKDKAGGAVSLEPQVALKFSDIPVPSGFQLLPQESYSFESQGVRVGVLKYRGRANVGRVVSFYKDQMPMHNWNFLNAVEYGDRLLNFDRENETCIINLSAKGDSITMTISVGPKSQFRKKSDNPLK